MKHESSTASANPTVDMSPLVDLSFLLLIYFLLTSTLEPQEGDLAMTLPGIGTTVRQIDYGPMTIEVNAEGHILANEEVLDTDSGRRDLPLLMDRLATYAESARLTRTPPSVLLEVDDGAKGQRFVDVLNTLADPRVDIREVSLVGFREE